MINKHPKPLLTKVHCAGPPRDAAWRIRSSCRAAYSCWDRPAIKGSISGPPCLARDVAGVGWDTAESAVAGWARSLDRSGWLLCSGSAGHLGAEHSAARRGPLADRFGALGVRGGGG